MRRLMALLLAALLAVGCGTASASPSGASAPADGVTLAMATAPRLAGSDADARAAGDAVNAFGLDLYARIRGGAGNLVVSPASIAVALAMARAGARGATAAEMDRVLHDLAGDGHGGWVASLDLALNARTGSFPDASGQSQPVTLRIVNAPFAQRGMALGPAFLDALASEFGAGVRLVDYRTEPEPARAAINAWVAEQTEQRIRELLGAGTITDLTRLVLVNAVYLKAAWQEPFNASATKPAPFHRLDGSSVEVPLMSGGGDLPYAAGGGWQAVQVPYVGGKLAMLVVVPDDLSAFEGGLDAATLGRITATLAQRRVVLGLPRFGTETKVELADVLKALGMPSAFSATTADFSGITTDERLLIDAVVHQANIDVDEKGTEAAAATAVTMVAGAMPAEPVRLTVDRPFLFALRDLDTGTVLFLGRITDPSATGG